MTKVLSAMAPHFRFAIPARGLAHVCTVHEMIRGVRDAEYVPQMQCGTSVRPVSYAKILDGVFELCRGCELHVNHP